MSGNDLDNINKALDYPQVSIVISTRNRSEVLKRCLDSIIGLNYPKNLLELIVLDDASSDSTPEEIPEYLEQMKIGGFNKTRFFRNEKNLGIIMGRYILGQKVSVDSKMVLFGDDDVVLEPDCLKVLTEYMVRNPDVGVIGPRIVYARDPQQPSHNANFVSFLTGRYWESDSAEPIACDWVFSACCLVRKSALERVGGFYPGYYICHGEVDFCLRVKAAGFKVIYHPGVAVRHEEALHQFKRGRLYYLYRNKLLLIRRNFIFPRNLIALLFIFLFGLPRYLLESIKYNRKIAIGEIKLIFLSIWHGLLGITGPKGER